MGQKSCVWVADMQWYMGRKVAEGSLRADEWAELGVLIVAMHRPARSCREPSPQVL
jgi:hypothetical protein